MQLRRSEIDRIDSSLLPLLDEPAVAGGAAERIEVDILLDADGYWHSAANGPDQRKNEDDLKQTQTTTRESWVGEDAQGARSSFNGVNTSTSTTAIATLRPVATASSLFAATFQACQTDALHRAIPHCHPLLALDLLVHFGNMRGICRAMARLATWPAWKSLCGGVPLEPDCSGWG